MNEEKGCIGSRNSKGQPMKTGEAEIEVKIAEQMTFCRGDADESCLADGSSSSAHENSPSMSADWKEGDLSVEGEKRRHVQGEDDDMAGDETSATAAVVTETVHLADLADRSPSLGESVIAAQERHTENSAATDSSGKKLVVDGKQKSCHQERGGAKEVCTGAGGEARTSCDQNGDGKKSQEDNEKKSSSSAVASSFDKVPFVIGLSDSGKGGGYPHQSDGVCVVTSIDSLALSAVPLLSATATEVTAASSSLFRESSTSCVVRSRGTGSPYQELGDGVSRDKWIPSSGGKFILDEKDLVDQSLFVDQVPAILLDFLKDETQNILCPPPGLERDVGEKLTCSGDGSAARPLSNFQEDREVSRLLQSLMPDHSAHQPSQQQDEQLRLSATQEESCEKGYRLERALGPPPPAPVSPPLISGRACAPPGSSGSSTAGEDTRAKSEENFAPLEARQTFSKSPRGKGASFIKADVIRAVFDGGNPLLSASGVDSTPSSSQQHADEQQQGRVPSGLQQGGHPLLEDASFLRLLHGENTKGNSSPGTMSSRQRERGDNSTGKNSGSEFMRQTQADHLQFQQQQVLVKDSTGVVEAAFVSNTGLPVTLSAPPLQREDERKGQSFAAHQQLLVHSGRLMASQLSAAVPSAEGENTNNSAKVVVPTSRVGGLSTITGAAAAGSSDDGDERSGLSLSFASCGRRTGERDRRSNYQSAGLGAAVFRGGSLTSVAEERDSETISRRTTQQVDQSGAPAPGQLTWSHPSSNLGGTTGREQPKSVSSLGSSSSRQRERGDNSTGKNSGSEFMRQTQADHLQFQQQQVLVKDSTGVVEAAFVSNTGLPVTLSAPPLQREDERKGQSFAAHQQLLVHSGRLMASQLSAAVPSAEGENTNNSAKVVVPTSRVGGLSTIAGAAAAGSSDDGDERSGLSLSFASCGRRTGERDRRSNYQSAGLGAAVFRGGSLTSVAEERDSETISRRTTQQVDQSGAPAPGQLTWSHPSSNLGGTTGREQPKSVSSLGSSLFREVHLSREEGSRSRSPAIESVPREVSVPPPPAPGLTMFPRNDGLTGGRDIGVGEKTSTASGAAGFSSSQQQLRVTSPQHPIELQLLQAHLAAQAEISDSVTIAEHDTATQQQHCRRPRQDQLLSTTAGGGLTSLPLVQEENAKNQELFSKSQKLLQLSQQAHGLSGRQSAPGQGASPRQAPFSSDAGLGSLHKEIGTGKMRFGEDEGFESAENASLASFDLLLLAEQLGRGTAERQFFSKYTRERECIPREKIMEREKCVGGAKVRGQPLSTTDTFVMRDKNSLPPVQALLSALQDSPRNLGGEAGEWCGDMKNQKGGKCAQTDVAVACSEGSLDQMKLIEVYRALLSKRFPHAVNGAAEAAVRRSSFSAPAGKKMMLRQLEESPSELQRSGVVSHPEPEGALSVQKSAAAQKGTALCGRPSSAVSPHGLWRTPGCMDLPAQGGLPLLGVEGAASRRGLDLFTPERVRGKKESPYGSERGQLTSGAAVPVHSVCKRLYMWEKLTVHSLAHSPPSATGQADSLSAFAGILSEGGRVAYCEMGIFAFGGRRGKDGELCNTVSWLRPTHGSSSFCWVPLPATGEAPPPCSGMIVCATTELGRHFTPSMSSLDSGYGRVVATPGGEQESLKSEDGHDVATKGGLDRNPVQGGRKSISDGNKAVVEPVDGATDGEAGDQESSKEGETVVGMRNSISEAQGGKKTEASENTPGPGLVPGGGPKLLVYGGRSRDGIADWNSLYSFDLTTHEWSRLSVDPSKLFETLQCWQDSSGMSRSESVASISSDSSLSSTDSAGQAAKPENSRLASVRTATPAKTEERGRQKPDCKQSCPQKAKRPGTDQQDECQSAGTDRNARQAAVPPPPMLLQDSSWCYSPYDDSLYVFGGIGRQGRRLRPSARSESTRESRTSENMPATNSAATSRRNATGPAAREPSFVMCGSWECRNQLWRLDLKVLRWTEVPVRAGNGNCDTDVTGGGEGVYVIQNGPDTQQGGKFACVSTASGSSPVVLGSMDGLSTHHRDRNPYPAGNNSTTTGDQTTFSWSTESVVPSDSWTLGGKAANGRVLSSTCTGADVRGEHLGRGEYEELRKRNAAAGGQEGLKCAVGETTERTGGRGGVAGGDLTCSVKPDRTLSGGNSDRRYPSIPKGRAGHSCVYKDGRLWVFGGFSTQEELGDIYSFDIQGRYWEEVIPCCSQGAADARALGIGVSTGADRLARPSPRYGHGAVVVEDSMFIFGGYGGKQSCLSDLWEFRLPSSRWSKLLVEGQIPLPRFRCSAAVLNDSLFIFEGRGSIQPSLPQHSTPQPGLPNGQCTSPFNGSVDQANNAAAPSSCKRSTVFTDAYRIHLSKNGARKVESPLLSKTVESPVVTVRAGLPDRTRLVENAAGGVMVDLSQQLGATLQSFRGESGPSLFVSEDRLNCPDSTCCSSTLLRPTSAAGHPSGVPRGGRAGDLCTGGAVVNPGSVTDPQGAGDVAQKRTGDFPRIVWNSTKPVKASSLKVNANSDEGLGSEVVSQLATRSSGKKVLSVGELKALLGETRRFPAAVQGREDGSVTAADGLSSEAFEAGTTSKTWGGGERGEAGDVVLSKPVELCLQLHQKLKATKEAEEQQRQRKEAALVLLGQYREVVEDLRQQLQAQPRRLQRMREEWAEEKEGLAEQVQRLSVALTDVYSKLSDVKKDMEHHQQREQKLNAEVAARDKVIAQQRRDVDALSTKYQQAQALFSRLLKDRSVVGVEQECGVSAPGVHHPSVAHEHLSRILSHHSRSVDGKPQSFQRAREDSS